ncbi:Ig domain-containing protein [Pyxidicoccus xibeiensis]|uniref:Ig domain-containing protein n=1 Tax=Pyxidicoccus xibeiensis TaxID=2906759 RepID=UPI0020A6DDA7|nr:putative Ig domain-containing protein [Pyxidicoccus xibeiensis]MCP3140716.1 Ig domain-containing protein [Pyxidicoccus xibeiensis]
MFNSRRATKALMGTALWLVSGCQSSSFISHEARVESGASVPLELHARFGSGASSSLDGQMVACVALPTGWSAPSGSYSFNGGSSAEGRAAAEVATEAQAAHAVEGAAWHCLTSDRVTIEGQTASTAKASLSLSVPAVAQGAYRLAYATGFRAVEPGEGEPTYAGTKFSGRLERVLHVNVAAATTFDVWAASSYGTDGSDSLASRVWYGNGGFLALSGETSLLSSTDGREWSRITPVREGTEDSLSINHLAFAHEKWFGISGGGIFSSADGGHTWAAVYSDPVAEGAETGREFVALAANGTRLVATGHAGLIAVSANGTEWTDQTANRAYTFSRVVAAQDTFIAVGTPEDAEATTGDILVRANAEGSGWDVLESAALAGREVPQLVAGNGRLMAFTWKESGETPSTESPGSLFLSRDRGTSWTKVEGMTAVGTAVAPESILLTFVDRTFVVATTLARLDTLETLNPLELQASPDGITWTSHATGAAGAFSADSFATGTTTVVGVSEELALVAERKAWAGPEIVTAALPYAVIGTAYSVELETRGPGGKTDFVVEGTMPAGLSLADGVISGSPTAEASAALTVVATDARGERAARPYTLDVVRALAISGGGPTTIVPKGAGFEARLTADGGRAPYTWSHTGAVAPGTTLQQEGAAYVLSGTLTATGTFAYTASVVDALGQKSTRSVSIRVVPGAVPEVVPEETDSQSCGGCSGTGGAGFQALGLAALALLRRSRRKK